MVKCQPSQWTSEGLGAASNSRVNELLQVNSLPTWACSRKSQRQVLDDLLS
jgi:hypothetical protein